MVDQLAKDYANQPVVFIEQNVLAPIGSRMDRYWAVQPDKNASYPYIMLDSGHQYWSNYAGNPQTQYNNYKRLVDAELTRPPKAEVSATMTRVGSHMQFKVTVKNLSSVTLSRSANGATIHAVVYEDTDFGLTSRYVRAAVALSNSSPLASNASAAYTLDTPDLAGVDWTKLHGLAMVDYRPGGSGPYDMLQAALATASTPIFAVRPARLTFLIDPARPNRITQTLSVTGSPAGVNWTAETAANWLTVSPSSGTVTTGSTGVVIRVNPDALAPGRQTAAIQFTPAGSASPQSIAITVYYQHINHLYLPNTRR